MGNKENILVLHLSDLHFSKNVNDDIDVKVPLQLNTHSEKIDQFAEYIKRLPAKPDYVVVSGDITTKGSSDGFEIFDKIVIDLINKGKLPPVKNFIVVPGNHDVQAGASIEDSRRWDNFKRFIGNKYLVPWIVGIGPTYDEMTDLVDKDLAVSKPVQGGIMQNPSTGENNSIPFLLDREKKVLFYAFNSSLLSHTKIKDEEASELISCAEKYKTTDPHLMGLARKLKQEMDVDPARIAEDEIKLFTYCMEKIQALLPDDYKNSLKIAVLHHHIAPISCAEEIKKFEMLINAGIFKRVLANYGFQVVLHGHKHWNEVYWDTAISGGGALLAVSGGTICGTPSKNKEAGFYLLDFSVKKKEVETHYCEMQNPYIGIVRTEEPVKFSYDTAGKSIGSVGNIQHFNIIDLYSRVERALLRNITCKEYKGDKQYGWSRIITSKDNVGMVSTAFGLIIAHMLGINDTEYNKLRDQIIDTLWNFRFKAGGFSAVSQVADSAIEPTVWALRAFYYVGDMAKFNITLQDLYRMNEENPLNEESSITTLTLMMDVLCECDPNSELLEQINNIILKTAHYCDDYPLYWPRSATENEAGSPVHTMLAVISLLNYAKVRGKLEETRNYLQRCGAWILEAKWDNAEEVITRPLTQRKRDRLSYHHYTLPWGIIALLRLGYCKKEKRIADEMKRLLEHEKDGLWAWTTDFHDHYPIWAIYNAISAINEFALCDIEL